MDLATNRSAEFVILRISQDMLGLDVELAEAGVTRGQPMTLACNFRSFRKQFNLLAERDDVVHPAVQKCSESSVAVPVVERLEGGAPIPTKSPGCLTFPEGRLERGGTQNRSLYEGVLDVAIASGSLGLTHVNQKRVLEVGTGGGRRAATARPFAARRSGAPGA